MFLLCRFYEKKIFFLELTQKRTKKQDNKKTTNNNNDSQTDNRKITDYFQVRKSSRRCKSDIEKERKLMLEKAIINHQEDGLIVKVLEDKGRGVFATKTFNKEEFIVEYAGELISYQEAKKREKKYSEDSAIGCYMYFFEFKSKKYCIDATAESGRLGRLLNHSKTSNNCHTKLYEINSKPVLAILASRDIEVDEELTYDYGDRSKFTLEAHPWLLT